MASDESIRYAIHSLETAIKIATAAKMSLERSLAPPLRKKKVSSEVERYLKRTMKKTA